MPDARQQDHHAPSFQPSPDTLPALSTTFPLSAFSLKFPLSPFAFRHTRRWRVRPISNRRHFDLEPQHLAQNAPVDMVRQSEPAAPDFSEGSISATLLVGAMDGDSVFNADNEHHIIHLAS